MKWLSKLGGGLWPWRWVTALALALGMVSVGAASADNSGTATIMILAPGAPLGAPVSVEWFDPLTNTWTPVTGWAGTLYQSTGSGVPFQAFGVLPANYGQTMFRWVVFNPATNVSANGNPTAALMTTAASTMWGASSPFTLPNSDGVTLQITVWPAQMLKVPNNVIGAKTTQGTTAANSVAGLTLSTIMAPLACPPAGCNSAAITGKFTGLPANSWITVEWLDGNGVWRPVLGWQGQADFIDGSGNLVKQFGVYQQNYGQGPFRWAIYNAPSGGSLMAISPNFNLPSTDGQNEILNLAS